MSQSASNHHQQFTLMIFSYFSSISPICSPTTFFLPLGLLLLPTLSFACLALDEMSESDLTLLSVLGLFLVMYTPSQAERASKPP